MAYRSRQRKYGGGKFKSEAQRRAIWANSKTLGHLWAHNLSARGHRSQWARVQAGAKTHSGSPFLRKRTPSSRGSMVRSLTGRTRRRKR